jgi:hypothetical protein
MKPKKVITFGLTIRNLRKAIKPKRLKPEKIKPVTSKLCTRLRYQIFTQEQHIDPELVYSTVKESETKPIGVQYIGRSEHIRVSHEDTRPMVNTGQCLRPYRYVYRKHKETKQKDKPIIVIEGRIMEIVINSKNRITLIPQK